MMKIEEFAAALALLDFAAAQRFGGSVWLWTGEVRVVGGQHIRFPRVYVDTAIGRQNATVSFSKSTKTFDISIEPFLGRNYLQEALNYITQLRYTQNGDS